jgi:hypothetical protein
LNSKYIKTILLLLIPLFFAFYIFDYKKNGSLNFGDNPTLVEFIFFIIIIIIYFFERMQLVNNKPIYNNINFWINVGLFVYFSGNFFYMLLAENSKNADINVKQELMLIYGFVTILKNLILGFSFFLSKNNTNNNNSIPFPEDLNLDAITPNNLIK